MVVVVIVVAIAVCVCVCVCVCGDVPRSVWHRDRVKQSIYRNSGLLQSVWRTATHVSTIAVPLNESMLRLLH